MRKNCSAFDRVNLDSHKLAAIIRVTNELLKDSAIDIEAYLADTFADRLAVGEEEAFIAGDGADKPLGLIHQAKVGCTTESAGSVAIEDVLNLIFSVSEKHRRNGTLLMNDNTLLSLFKQCAALGTNLWQGKDDTFFGYCMRYRQKLHAALHCIRSLAGRPQKSPRMTWRI